MKLIELKETEAAGNRDPLNRRHYADGKRISREQFDAIKRGARSLDSFSNASVNGVQTFYCTARID